MPDEQSMTPENQRDEDLAEEIYNKMLPGLRRDEKGEALSEGEWAMKVYLEALTAQRQSWEREKAGLREIIKTENGKVNHYIDKSIRLEAEKKGLEERVRWLTGDIDQAQKDVNGLRDELTRLKSRNEELEESAQGNICGYCLKHDVDDCPHNPNKITLETEASGKGKIFLKESTKIEKLEKKLEYFQSQFSHYQALAEKVTLENERLKDKVAELEREANAAVESFISFHHNPVVRQKNEELDRLKAENAELQKESYECTCTKDRHGSLCRYCYVQTALSVCKENTEQKETISRLTSALARAHEAFNHVKKELEETALVGATQTEKLRIKEIWEFILEILKDPTGKQAHERWKRMEVIYMKSRLVVPGLLKKDNRDIKTLESLLEKEGSGNVCINPDGSITASPEMESLRQAIKEFEALDAKGERE